MFCINYKGEEVAYNDSNDFLTACREVAEETGNMEAYEAVRDSMERWGEVDEEAAAQLGFTF